MMFRSFVVLVFIGMSAIAEENCTSQEVSTSIDQSGTNMKVEERFIVINAITNATLKGGSDTDVAETIFYGLNPRYNKEKLWIVIQDPSVALTWQHAKMKVTACLCDKCKKYRIYYIKT